jgi:hypothetical protein
MDSTPAPEIEVAIDDVSLEITDALTLAAQSQVPTTVIYRPYLLSDRTQPHMNPPLTLTLFDATATQTQVTARARMLNIGNKSFPSRTYTLPEFPGLL